ncbi:hypothetical protein LEP1GSC047_0339 [Leptospira inadai serovar Lyme str. 10]|uniref:YCII-related domain-containing protein n=2 Tax=Leptospira inadai serovar Lyme TaxID=293084 RepID=V6HBB8_9LEPT|nr:YciI family protein [Leptospira inadai]EQA35863.1 hypothetical protein LEP1GSC047_0339 [Leptospira inadai serovar Lyme str. 10]PNV76837.1 hypothetical protein BES34_000695 [Leptospira inadai serovar Lyme]
MKYQLLIYMDEKASANAPMEETGQMSEEYKVYTEALLKAGVMLGGDRLHPTASAATVRMQNGKKVTTHGPFAETKEQLGGYYLIECNNLDEAIDWASKCPGVRYGSVEVRPVFDMAPVK